MLFLSFLQSFQPAKSERKDKHTADFGNVIKQCRIGACDSLRHKLTFNFSNSSPISNSTRKRPGSDVYGIFLAAMPTPKKCRIQAVRSVFLRSEKNKKARGVSLLVFWNGNRQNVPPKYKVAAQRTVEEQDEERGQDAQPADPLELLAQPSMISLL